MNELVERLRAHLGDDHVHGCQGRQYSCDCGYDLKTEGFLELAADELERLSRPSPSEDVARLRPDLNAMALLKRLRRPGSYCAAGCEGRCVECPDSLIRDAAAYIEHAAALAAESDASRLREALEEAVEYADIAAQMEGMPAGKQAVRLTATAVNLDGSSFVTKEFDVRKARAALIGTGDGWRGAETELLRHLCDVVAQYSLETPNHFLSTKVRDRLIQQARDTLPPPSGRETKTGDAT
jgi:hypothetical protein